MLNGTFKDFFKSRRGLRQGDLSHILCHHILCHHILCYVECGDLLFPYLFILMEEVLTRMLKMEFEASQIGKFYHPRDCPSITHLFYVDDLLVFTNGARCSIAHFLSILEKYEQWSGQSLLYIFLNEDQQYSEKGSKEAFRFYGGNSPSLILVHL